MPHSVQYTIIGLWKIELCTLPEHVNDHNPESEKLSLSNAPNASSGSFAQVDSLTCVNFNHVNNELAGGIEASSTLTLAL